MRQNPESQVTGSQRVEHERFSVVSKQGGLPQAETGAPLMTADQVRRLEPGELLAIVRHVPPVRLEQCRWYADRDHVRRVTAV